MNKLRLFGHQLLKIHADGYDGGFDEDDFKPGDHSNNDVDEDEYDDKDIEAVVKSNEMRIELFKRWAKKVKSPEFIDIIDDYEKIINQNMSHLFNRYEVQSKYYVIREKLRLLRDKLMKRRKIRHGDKHIKFAIIDALCDMHKIIMKNLVDFKY